MEAGIQRARGQRNAQQVVAGGPDQILAHYAQGGAGQINRRGDGRGPCAHEQHIAGLLGQVGAGTHGDAGVSLGQGGCVVDAVARHGHAQAALLQGANAGQLAGRIEASFDFGDPRLQADRLGRLGRVASQHQHPQTSAPQRSHGLGCIRTQCVAGVEVAGGHVVESHPQARHARLRRICVEWQGNEELLEERFVAQQTLVAFHLGGQTAAGQNLYLFRGLPDESASVGRIHNGVGQRMIRPLLGGGGQAQQVIFCALKGHGFSRATRWINWKIGL